MPIGGSTTSASRCQLAVCVDVQQRIIAQAGTSIDRSIATCNAYATPYQIQLINSELGKNAAPMWHITVHGFAALIDTPKLPNGVYTSRRIPCAREENRVREQRAFTWRSPCVQYASIHISQTRTGHTPPSSQTHASVAPWRGEWSSLIQSPPPPPPSPPPRAQSELTFGETCQRRANGEREGERYCKLGKAYGQSGHGWAQITMLAHSLARLALADREGECRRI